MKSIAKYALTTVVAAVLAAPAWAQDTAEGAGASDIIVTARRQEERLQDVPISITVLSQEAISKRNIVSGADLGPYVPSLAIEPAVRSGKEPASRSAASPRKARLRLRWPSISPMSSPRARSAARPRAMAPASARSWTCRTCRCSKGRKARCSAVTPPVATILLVPAKPKDKLEGYVEGSLGNYNLHRVQAVLNAPLGSSVRVRAAVDWNQRDGYLVNH